MKWSGHIKKELVYALQHPVEYHLRSTAEKSPALQHVPRGAHDRKIHIGRMKHEQICLYLWMFENVGKLCNPLEPAAPSSLMHSRFFFIQSNSDKDRDDILCALRGACSWSILRELRKRQRCHILAAGVDGGNAAMVVTYNVERFQEDVPKEFQETARIVIVDDFQAKLKQDCEWLKTIWRVCCKEQHRQEIATWARQPHQERRKPLPFFSANYFAYSFVSSKGKLGTTMLEKSQQRLHEELTILKQLTTASPSSSSLSLVSSLPGPRVSTESRMVLWERETKTKLMEIESGCMERLGKAKTRLLDCDERIDKIRTSLGNLKQKMKLYQERVRREIKVSQDEKGHVRSLEGKCLQMEKTLTETKRELQELQPKHTGDQMKVVARAMECMAQERSGKEVNLFLLSIFAKFNGITLKHDDCISICLKRRKIQ